MWMTRDVGETTHPIPIKCGPAATAIGRIGTCGGDYTNTLSCAAILLPVYRTEKARNHIRAGGSSVSSCDPTPWTPPAASHHSSRWRGRVCELRHRLAAHPLPSLRECRLRTRLVIARLACRPLQRPYRLSSHPPPAPPPPPPPPAHLARDFSRFIARTPAHAVRLTC